MADLGSLTLAEMKLHLRVSHDDEDPAIEQMIAAARRHVEAWCGPLDDMRDGVPEDLTAAMKMLVAHLYQGREAVTFEGRGHEMPLGFFDLVNPHRQWGF